MVTTTDTQKLLAAELSKAYTHALSALLVMKGRLETQYGYLTPAETTGKHISDLRALGQALDALAVGFDAVDD